MPAVSFGDAAAHLGHRSRSGLYRAKGLGLLRDYLRPGGKGGADLLELEPEGLPTLRQWWASVNRQQINSPPIPDGPAPAGAATVPAMAPDAEAVAAVAQGLAQLVAGLPEDQIPRIDVSRERREHYAAELARLEALQRRGDLLPADQVKAAAFAHYREIRDALMQLPHRVAPELVGLDVRGAHRVLDEEIRRLLQRLASSEGVAADLPEPEEAAANG